MQYVVSDRQRWGFFGLREKIWKTGKVLGSTNFLIKGHYFLGHAPFQGRKIFLLNVGYTGIKEAEF
jgi:hypothetical protein